MNENCLSKMARERNILNNYGGLEDVGLGSVHGAFHGNVNIMARSDARGSLRFTAFPFQPEGRYVCGCLDVCAAMILVSRFLASLRLLRLKLLSAGWF